jgi:hypothetical protein
MLLLAFLDNLDVNRSLQASAIVDGKAEGNFVMFTGVGEI